MWFGVRNTKRKVFHPAKLDDNMDPVISANELLDKMKTNPPTGIDNHPTQANDEEDSANKSVVLEVQSN